MGKNVRAEELSTSKKAVDSGPVLKRSVGHRL